MIESATPQWIADVLPGFEQITLSQPAAADGPVEIVLVRRRNPDATKAAVLYIHGFVDYFFQTHLADFYATQGLHFYALDLRRHGRSLRAHQLPNFTTDIDEYIADLDAAIGLLQGRENIDWLLVNGHSTGGLIAALHAHRGRMRSAVNALFLNSPFLDMNLPRWQVRFAEPLASALGKWLPHWQLPPLSRTYVHSIHADFHGEWQFDTRWKPIAGFPVLAGWFRAIHRAQAEVERGLLISCPCLVLHAARSARYKTWEAGAMTADTVLNEADMRRLGPRLGKQVEVAAIPDGMHDLTLSGRAAREYLWNTLAAWINKVKPD